MSTTTVRMQVNILDKAVNFIATSILRIGYRIEHGRGLNGHMISHHQFYEEGIRVWLTEAKLIAVFYELWDPTTNEAYETAEIILDYTTDPNEEEVVAPPVDELEAMLKKLRDLPPGARFRLVARRAPGYTHVDGWVPTQLKPLKNGVGQTMTIGDEKFGYGPISGELVYTVSNWGQEHEGTQGTSHQ